MSTAPDIPVMECERVLPKIAFARGPPGTVPRLSRVSFRWRVVVARLLWRKKTAMSWESVAQVGEGIAIFRNGEATGGRIYAVGRLGDAGWMEPVCGDYRTLREARRDARAWLKVHAVANAMSERLAGGRRRVKLEQAAGD